MNIGVIGDQYVWVSDGLFDTIQKFTLDGTYISQVGGQGTGDGQFIAASEIAVDNRGYFCILDYTVHRIQRYTPDGDFIRVFGVNGSAPG